MYIVKLKIRIVERRWRISTRKCVYVCLRVCVCASSQRPIKCQCRCLRYLRVSPSFRVVSRGWQTRSVWKTQKLRNVKHLSVLSSALRAAGHATKSPARLLSDVPAVVVNNAPHPANRRRRRNQLNPVLLERLFRATLGTTFG